MKRFLTILLLITLIGTLAACSPPASEPVDTLPLHEAPEAAPEKTVTFADPVLEAMVRATMGKKLEGGITVAEAEAVTRLNLSFEWQRYVSEETPIQDIGGLEYFKNLENLDLSFHAITDITPLAGLTKLTMLSLGGNPVADIAPLAALTNLKVLALSGCAAQDYSPLAKLVKLEFLMLNNSAITDVSPLASLTGLKHLYLTGSPINNYFPLSDIYQNLEQKDFTIAFTLAELGFTMNDANNQATYGDVQHDGLSVNINHAEWGAPQSEDMTKCVRMDLMLDSGYTLAVLYYPEISAYVFQMNINGEQMNYIYNAADSTFMVDSNNRERFERMITEALGEMGETDTLLAPIPVFDDTIRKTFGMTAGALYELPFEPPTLRSLGFVADESISSYLYEQREPHYYTIQIANPQWGSWEGGGDVRFFTPLSDEYRLVITYYIHERKFIAGADDNDRGGAGFELFIDTYEHVDGWCSYEEMTVEEYFINAYNDPEIEDIYRHSVELMLQYINDTFGMTIEELYALPAGI